jgi:hypothetical protein
MKTDMKKIFYLSIVIIFISNTGYGQSDNYNVSPFSVKLFNSFQAWNIGDDNNLYQLSNRLSLNYRADKYTAVNLSSSYSASEVQSRTLNGLTDIQLQVSHKLNSINTIVEAGINIPSGKESLSSSEFSSTILLSRDIFNFRNPILGQGTNIFAGATWAAEIENDIVIGAGASYQIRGEYQPLTEQSSIYNPSDELLLSAGIDFRIDKTKNISADITGVFFNEDKVDGEIVFSAGNRFVYSLGYKQYFNKNIFSFTTRYRYSGEDEIQNLIAVSNEKFTSNYLIISASFYHSISGSFAILYQFEARHFEETLKQFSGYSSYSPGLILFFELSNRFEIPIHIKYLLGSNGGSTINGIDSAIGFNLKF